MMPFKAFRRQEFTDDNKNEIDLRADEGTTPTSLTPSAWSLIHKWLRPNFSYDYISRSHQHKKLYSLIVIFFKPN